MKLYKDVLGRLLLPVLGAAALGAAAPTDQVVALLTAKHYAEARQGAEAILAADPKNARACWCMSRIVQGQDNSVAGLKAAVAWMKKATDAAPAEEEFLSAYGQLAIQLAGRDTSFSAAQDGRKALEEALKANPDDLPARETLYEYFRNAPWPLSSKSDAAAQLGEIRRRNPTRAFLLVFNDQMNAKDYPGAFQSCESMLAADPGNVAALYNYGRAALASGQNMEKGATNLEKAAKTWKAGFGVPSLASVWTHAGDIRAKLGDPEWAKEAYHEALKVDPKYKSAAAALAQLE